MSICAAARREETDTKKFSSLKPRYFDKDAVIVETFGPNRIITGLLVHLMPSFPHDQA